MNHRALLRVSSSALSWLLFAFCFTLLLLSAAALVGLGTAACASGGPFDIRTQCPDTITWVAPLSLPAAIVALVIGAYLGGGFGTPLTTWAFPLTFIGYGAAFLFAAVAAGIGWGFVVCGALFLIMGVIPLAIVLRADPRRAIVGTIDLRGRRFVAGPNARRGFYRYADAEPAGTLVPTLADGARSLFIALAASAIGAVLAQLVFSATSA